MPLIALELGRIEDVGRRRIAFSSDFEWAPKRKVYLDGSRIYAIYKVSNDKHIVVYETDDEKLKFYRSYRAKYIPNIEPIPKISFDIPVCPDGEEAEVVDYEDGIYACKEGFITNPRYVEHIVYQKRNFDPSQVETGEPEKDPEKIIITGNNLSYALKEILKKRYGIDIETTKGYKSLGGGRYISYVDVKKEEKIGLGDATLVEGLGFAVDSFYDSPRIYAEPGYYVSIETFDPERRTTEVAFAKLRDIYEDEKIKFVAKNPELALEWGWDKSLLIKYFNENLDEASKYNINFLRKIDEDLARKTYEYKIREAMNEIRERMNKKEIFYTNKISLLEEHKDLSPKLFEELKNLWNEYTKLREVWEREAEEKRMREKEEKRKRLINEIINRIPEWADVAVVYKEFLRPNLEITQIHPAKTSRYGKNRYYYKKDWRKIYVPYKEYEDLLDNLLAGKRMIIITKDGRIIDAKTVGEGDYITIEVVKNEEKKDEKMKIPT